MNDSILDTKQKETPLVYRSKLSIPSKINFGLEFELDKISLVEVYRLTERQFGSSWSVKSDDSLTLGQNAEIVSPILQNNTETWVTLKKLSKLLNQLNPNYEKCSFQVNFDGTLLPSDEDKFKFLKFYAMYEDIIYRFSKGEDLFYRESLEQYAAPIILVLKAIKAYGADSAVELFSNTKRRGIGFKEKENLIEFRTPNATNNPILWQNYITTFYYLLTFSKSDKCNQEEVEQYIDEFSKTYLLEYYEKEHKQKALTLSNMIFKNNIDKTNFMHQYLGIKK